MQLFGKKAIAQRLGFAKIAFIGLFLGLAPTSATGFTLDAFNDADEEFHELFLEKNDTPNPTNPDTKTGLTGTTLGGSRTLELEANFGVNASRRASALLSINPGSNRFEWSIDTNVTSNFSITWDNNGAGLGGVDLTQNGDDSFAINVNDTDIDVTLNFEVTSGGSTTLITNTVTNLDDGQTVYFPYTSGGASTSFFQSVDSVRLYSDETGTADISFDLFETATEVPFEFSPTLGLIVGGGLLGFLRLKKKLKSSEISN